MKKLVINKNKNQLIRENRLRADSLTYLLINAIIDIAEKEEIDSDYVEILKRIRDENYSKLKKFPFLIGRIRTVLLLQLLPQPRERNLK